MSLRHFLFRFWGHPVIIHIFVLQAEMTLTSQSEKVMKQRLIVIFMAVVDKIMPALMFYVKGAFYIGSMLNPVNKSFMH